MEINKYFFYQNERFIYIIKMTCKHCSINNTYQNSKYGLCEICDQVDFQRMIIILRESTNLINTTKNIETLINRCPSSFRSIRTTLKELEH